jgi:hypothetical protein
VPHKQEDAEMCLGQPCILLIFFSNTVIEGMKVLSIRVRRPAQKRKKRR